MKRLFADACYWIALLNPKDPFHETAQRVSKDLGSCRIVTSEMVLVELLNGLARFGKEKRAVAVQVVKSLQSNPNVEIVPQTSLQFQSATDRYASGQGMGRNGLRKFPAHGREACVGSDNI